jgi:hypothetical protein
MSYAWDQLVLERFQSGTTLIQDALTPCSIIKHDPRVGLKLKS